ncbi:hypothetical protein CVT25_001328 [Psilocybe cyanescens]|uniref:Uncharacterized protein n=1 Tax=Psilocybe cyanescens TaxID=93625 RepID=A0A409XEN3_PSICY|nr:hypothetical protein CVT25_001328 [Psilocybe cyanescens]
MHLALEHTNGRGSFGPPIKGIDASVHSTACTFAARTVIQRMALHATRLVSCRVDRSVPMDSAPNLAQRLAPRAWSRALGLSILKCGHSCPSVCGEICEQQKCIVCLNADQKQEIVDFIMQRQLNEIDLTSEDVADRLITLKCGHIFTVETLDGHCKMSEFYEVDEMGTYVRTRVPPVEYQTPPTCPQCRGPITALRYGRVVKRSTLDILEQNVASTMSRSLEKLGPDLEHVSKSLDSYKERAKSITSDTSNLGSISQDCKTAAIEKQEPVSKSLLDLSAMNSIHALSPQETRTWNTLVKPILDVYGRAQNIAMTRGAHVKAYEGALATLYRLEREAIANNPSIVTDSPEPMALRAVHMSIGQPPPTADSRFQIEAYIHTLELRFMLAQVGLARIESLSSTATDELDVKHKKHWKAFVEFIYDSCVADSRKALAVAEKSSASRRAAKCKVFIMRSDFERFRFLTIVGTKSLKVSDPNFADNRERMAQQVSDTRESMIKQLSLYQREYTRSRPTGNKLSLLMEEWKWFKENCATTVQRFVDELEELGEWVKNGKLYEPLSHSEMEDIVKAFRTTFGM